MSPVTAAGALAGFLITTYVGLKRAGMFADVARCGTPISVGPCSKRMRDGVCAKCAREGRS